MFVVAANEGVDEPTKTAVARVRRGRHAAGRRRSPSSTTRAPTTTASSRQAQDAFGDKVVPVYLREGDRLVGPAQRRPRARRAARRAHRGGHRGVRGRVADGPLPRRRGDRPGARWSTDLERAVARGSFHPVIPVDSTTGIGADRAARPGRRRLPLAARAPAARGLHPGRRAAVPAITCDPDGPLVAEVVKTTTDPYVGRVSLVRVFSGTVAPDATVHVSGHFSSFFGEDTGHHDHDEDERIGALSVPLGKTLRPAERGHRRRHLRDRQARPRPRPATPCPTRTPRCVLRPWNMPEPLLPLAIEARAKADEDKLSQGLQRLAAEDPTLRIEHNAETHQIVLWCMGEAHADVVIDRLGERYGAVGRPGRAQGAAAGDVRRRAARATAGTSSSPAATGSTPSATSRSSRCPQGAGLRVRRQGRRRLRAAAVHPLGREGRPAADGEGRRRRLPGRRHPGDAARRQVAQRRLLRHGLPDRRRARPARGRGGLPHQPARARRRDRRARPRRPGRHGHERPLLAPRPRARHGARSATTAPSCGPRCRRSRSPATPSTCARSATAPRPSPGRSRATSRCRTTSPRKLKD